MLIKANFTENDYCFNRYMVECEFNPRFSIKDRLIVLIDTWWNVNYKYHLMF